MRIYENLKSIVLTLLIGISLFLTGSLWFDNYYGLSSVMSDMISFFYPKIDLEDTKYVKEYVMPYKTTITNGDNGKWVYYVSSEPNVQAFNFIKELLINLTDFSVDSAYSSEWKELVNRKSIICDFAGKIDAKMLNLVLNNKLEFSNATPIYISGIAITKTTTGARIYIKSDELIYRITINNIEGLDQIISKYSNFKTYAKYVMLDELGVKKFNDREIVTQYNVLLPVSTKVENRQNVSNLILTKTLDEDNEKIEEKIENIFNSEEYIKFITEENGYIYINDDESVIKVLPNDIIEYTAESENEIIDDVTWISSFNTALRFISNASSLDNLYLISATSENDTYKFAFGAYIAEIPIIDTNKTIVNDEKVKLYIEVKNNCVINYKERAHEYSADLETLYISKFVHNILDEILEGVPKNSEIEIDSVELVYDIASNKSLPIWKVEYKFNDIIDVVLIDVAKLRSY